jgi:hypothetical protein
VDKSVLCPVHLSISVMVCHTQKGRRKKGMPPSCTHWPLSAKIDNNQYSYTSTPPLCHQSMHTDNCSFILPLITAKNETLTLVRLKVTYIT